MTWMCELCYPNGREVGIIVPGYSLIHHEGKYHILAGQGHKGDVILTFPHDPWPDPDPECAEGLTPEQEALSDKWVNELDGLCGWRLTPGEAWCLLNRCRSQAGWDPNEFFTRWLFDHCGKMIQAGGPK